MGRTPHRGHRHLVAACDAEPGLYRAAFGGHPHRAEQPERVRTAGELDGAAMPPHPGRGLPVLEPRGQRHPHVDLAGHPLDQPDQHRIGAAYRHAVGHPDDARGGGELGLQHQRAGQVPAPDLADPAGRGDLPVTIPLVAEQRGETGFGIEPGQAQPVNRAVPADQRGRVQVTDECIVFDRRRHAQASGWSGVEACSRKGGWPTTNRRHPPRVTRTQPGQMRVRAKRTSALPGLCPRGR